MPLRPTSLRGHLVVLVLALAIPAIALEAWWGYREYQEATVQARIEALDVGGRVAGSLQQFLVTTGALMNGVARELGDRFESQDRCYNITAIVNGVLPYFVNTIVLAADGTLVCSAAPVSLSALEGELPHPVPPGVTEGSTPQVGPPVHDLVSGQWVLPVAVPLQATVLPGPGTLIGLIPLPEFQFLTGGARYPQSYLITIATSELQVITRSTDAAAWAGQTLPTPTSPDEVMGPGRRVATGPDASGVERAWGILDLPYLGWVVFVGVREDEVNAPALASAMGRVGLTTLFLLAGILLATASYRRIAGSLRRLVKETGEVGPGRRMPLPPGTPAEVSAVVEQLNRTLDARDTAEEAERRALERYASIFNEAVFGIFVASPDGRVVEANSALARMLGYNEIRPVLDAPLADHFVDPDQHDIMRARCLAEGAVEGFLAEWQRADGKSIVVRIDGKAVRTDDGQDGLEMIVDDVTEELRRDRELQQTQKMEAVGRLAGGISHDFNNLLTVISANAELIDEGLDPASPVRPDLAQIRTAASRATALTRQLLAFSRSDPSTSRPVDLNAVVSELDAMLRRLIGDNVRLQTSLDPDLPTIQADPSRIEQVVMNLVLNARDALPHGGSIRIATKSLPASDGGASEVLLTVADDGTGMDPRTRSRLFEPFFTTKTDGRGTGLGLATVYGIVRQSGGRIEVDSAEEQGSTFRIWLPVASAAEGAA